MSTGGADADFIEALEAEPDPMKRIRMVARYSRQQWQKGAVELDLMLFSPDIKDPRLVELAERVLTYKREINRTICTIVFPDSLRRPDVSLDEIADYATAVDSGAAVSALMRLGWTMDHYEDWLGRLLALFLDPAKVPEAL